MEPRGHNGLTHAAVWVDSSPFCTGLRLPVQYRMLPMDTQGALYTKVAESIAQSIRTGTLQRGDRVPSVRDVAQRHGVSISTAIQAYRSLEDAQLIEARSRSGFYVAARPGQMPEPKASRPPERPRPVSLSAVAVQVQRYAYDPDYISFGAACPGSELFDNDRMRRVVNRTIQRDRSLLTHYPLGSAQEPLRRAIARHTLGLGCAADPDQIVITHGCLEAISLSLRAVTQPGDVVALESPTYFGFMAMLQTLQLQALEIPTHPRTGLSLEALQLALDTQPVRAVLGRTDAVEPTRVLHAADRAKAPCAHGGREGHSAHRGRDLQRTGT